MSGGSALRKRKLPASFGVMGDASSKGNDDFHMKSKNRFNLSISKTIIKTESKYQSNACSTNMKVLTIPPQLPIKYCITSYECKQCCIQIQRYIDTKPNEIIICGLDAEWNTTFKAGVSNPVALLQICIDGKFICLFHIIHYSKYESCSKYRPHIPTLPSELVELLKNPNIIKVGLNVKGDITRLGKDFPSQLTASLKEDQRIADVSVTNSLEISSVDIILSIPISSSPCDTVRSTLQLSSDIDYDIDKRINESNADVGSDNSEVGSSSRSASVVKSVCDLRNIAKAFEFACNQDTKRQHIVWPTKGSLSDLINKLSCYHNLPVILPKPTQIRCGDWEHKPLGKEQLMYAAVDAYASWFACQQMKDLYLFPSTESTSASAKDSKNLEADLQQFKTIIRNCAKCDAK